ncbi:hypothetical protein K493DRAFT_297682 [Basidiobolus meristosporus CBS 931.73]|uniref:Uncharacterized protein n=1 Tax=Basidiobolus meristosporus CBS 931.73 TaxID=1314790 RepID=A0A1Y1YYV6_9FUNG|nr:hypothetical protein K493DRAFT_297682 [Basidiobolus meristosporus CBS 931.73]|eukprot:ORY02887.1 hypothetical protein K493DRAFT_297682 [Basidiobolus meristosporus CBS 931.73]
MTRLTSAVAGIIVSGALIHYFRSSIEEDLKGVRTTIYDARQKLEETLPNGGSPRKVDETVVAKQPPSTLDHIYRYQRNLNESVFPSFKRSWNEGVSRFANRVSNINLDANQLISEWKQK